MKPCFQLTFILILWIGVTTAKAQTLNEQLLTENPTQLAEQARKNGNIVRGAILFHQGNINCVKCHRPNAEKDRLGPDLSRIDPQTTDELIIESILSPSKQIKAGFETIAVLTVDGKTYLGIAVEQDDEKVVIRDNQEVDRLITLLRQDIDEIQPAKKSSMPENLANELKNRQQFLDLVRYVIDVKERGPTAESPGTSVTANQPLDQEVLGLALIQELKCQTCHPNTHAPTSISPKHAPNLTWSGKKLNPHYLAKFIADPQRTKPGTSMPGLPGKLDANERKKSAEALTHFISSQVGNDFHAQPIDTLAVKRGFELFHSVGCVACHSTREANSTEQNLSGSTALGDLSQKYNVEGLVEFLENPHAVRPSGKMPNMQLNHFEAVDISNYLLQNSTATSTHWKPNPELAKTGRQLFEKLNCAQCHTTILENTPPPASKSKLADLRLDQGCLSGDAGDWPNFQLSDSNQKLIRETLRQFPTELSNDQQIQLTLHSYNCFACHDRNGIGGVSDERSVHFKTDNMNLGEQGRIPPTLTGVGAKLKSTWMRDVLVNGRSIRPYMKSRMPQFGEENIGHLVDLFESTDKLPEIEFPKFDDQKEMRKTGLELAGHKGLNCVACHTYQYKLADTMPAVDLTEMTERLKKNWFHRYMLNPQNYSPNTVMPSFWPGGVGIRKDLKGDPDFQVEALWQYLIDGRQARMPSGVVREPLEIIVSDEAQMLRRAYPGIGKRGIGVGYPGGINLAFDAEQMRLAMVWKGKFADPGGVWTGQGHGQVRPMERPINFAKGPDLDDAKQPWVVDDGRPPQHRLKGYTLDQSRRPTFRYNFESIEVEDKFEECESTDPKIKLALKRFVSMQAKLRRDQLAFRITSAKEISAVEEKLFLIDNQLRIRINSDHTAIIEDGELKTLRILLNLEEGKAEALELEYAWE